MSRLIEEFHKATRVTTRAMGFRTARSATPVPKMLLIAGLQAGAGGSLTGNTEGAHAALVHFTGAAPTAKTTTNIASSLPDLPWGFSLDEVDDKKASALVNAGADFMLFSASSRINAAPGKEKLGKILQVESSMDDGLLRAANNLPVDAVMVADTSEGGGPLVWHQLMIYGHLANFISKPLIVPAPASIDDAELKALWEAGVDGIIVASAESLHALRQAVDGLPPRSLRKREKPEAVLPHLSTESKPEPPEEDGEE
jgi:hypothetical protein